MRRFLFYFCSLLSLICCADKIENNQDDEELIAIKLKAGGELIESQVPLTRASSSALYGIQVYKYNDNEKETEYIAFGIFDDLSKAEILLPKNKKVDIEMTYIPNGKDVIYYHTSMDCWELPFNTVGWGASPLNTIVYSKSERLYALGDGMNNSYDNSNRMSAAFNEVDRYYGYYKDYTPSENGVIVIDMKRAVFGLTFKAKKNEAKTYDKILVQLNADTGFGGFPAKKYYITIDPNSEVSELVIPYICFMNVKECVMNPEYREVIKISIGTDERPDEILYEDISLKRNTMHIYEFDAIDQGDIPNGITAQTDNTPMEDEVISID